MTTTSIDAALIRCQTCGAINRVPVRRLRENPLCGKCKGLLDYPMKTVQATTATFEQEVASWPEAVLVLFRAQDCPDCRMAESVMDDVAFLRTGRLKVLAVDAETEQTLARNYAVGPLPTFILLRGGAPIARLEGVPLDKAELHQWVELHLNK
jgi:thioredoxin 2